MIAPAGTRIDLDRFLALKTAAERRLSAAPSTPAVKGAAPSFGDLFRAKNIKAPASAPESAPAPKSPAARPAMPDEGLLSAYGANRPVASGDTAIPRRALGNFFDAVA